MAVDDFYVRSDEDVLMGHQFLSYEVGVTGEPDIPAGKGSPSTVRLFVGDRQVGEGHLPVTTPIMHGIGGAAQGERTWASRHRVGGDAVAVSSGP